MLISLKKTSQVNDYLNLGNDFTQIETDNLTLIERIRLYSDVVNYSIIVGNSNCGCPNARKALLIELST